MYRLRYAFPDLGLALGPFGVWHVSNPTLTTRESAMKRMNLMHEISLDCTNDRLLEAIGWFQDSHVPLVTHPGDCKIHIVYQKELDPETNFRVSTIPEQIKQAVRRAWLCCGVAQDDCSAEFLAIIKLLLKGMPQPPSIRYIYTQLLRCASLGGFAERSVRYILLMHLLGAHRGRTRMCTPAARCRLRQMSAEQLCYAVSHLSSRQLYSILAEFVVKVARFDQALWDVCSARYGDFANKVLSLRIEHDLVPTLSPGEFTPSGSAASIGAVVLCSTMKIKKKVPSWAEAILTREQISLATTEGRMRGGIEAMGLVECGVSTAAAMSLITIATKKTDIVRLLKGFTQKEQALLTCYLLGMVRSDIEVTTLTKQATSAQISGMIQRREPIQHLSMVCTQCQTWRPKSRSIEGASKATAGCAVDIDRNCVKCLCCQSESGLKLVNPVGRLILAKTKYSGKAKLITACVGCGQASTPIVWRNVHPLCKRCSQTIPRRECSFFGCSKTAIPPIFELRTENSVKGVTACRKHAAILRAAGPERNERDMKNWVQAYKPMPRTMRKRKWRQR